MKILALDLGCKTGWAHSCGRSGTWDIGAFAGAERFAELFRQVETVESWDGLDFVAYEAPFFVPNRRGCLLGIEFAAVAALSSVWFGEYTPRAVAATTIKKHATGSGRAKKPEMLAAARAKWGPKVKTHDEGDALWLLDYIQQQELSNAV